MVRILVSHLIEMNGNPWPRADVKIQLALAVVQQFPKLKDVEGEGYEAWFAQGNGTHHTTGYIEERLKNVRKRLPKNVRKRMSKQSWKNKGVHIKKKPPKEPSMKERIESKANSVEQDPEIEQEEIFEDMKAWLKHNKQPKEQVIEYMKQTALKRQAEIHEKKQTVSDLTRTWPRIFDLPEAMDIDFRAVYGNDVADRLVIKWTDDLSKKVLEYGAKQSSTAQELYDKSKAGMNVQNRSIMSLPLFLPTGKLDKRSKTYKKATVKEAMDSFIDIQPIGTNIPTYLDDVMKNGNQRQPYILALGTKDNLAQFFTIVEDHVFEQDSLLKAVDICFKSFYVLDLDYPSACHTTWEFLQQVLYQIKDSGGKGTSSSIRSLRTFIMQ